MVMLSLLGFVKKMFNYVFFDYWLFLFGEIVFYCFFVFVVMGIYLMFFFELSYVYVVYYGVYVLLCGMMMMEVYCLMVDFFYWWKVGLLIW